MVTGQQRPACVAIDVLIRQDVHCRVQSDSMIWRQISTFWMSDITRGIAMHTREDTPSHNRCHAPDLLCVYLRASPKLSRNKLNTNGIRNE